jgi:hypothetical protein
MRASAAVLTAVVSLLLVGTATAGAKLQRTADGKTLVGHTRNGFRIVSHHIDIRMKAPRSWRVALCTEEPLNADVVCVSPDKKSLVSVIVRDSSAGDLTAAPEDYLRQLRRFKDPKIEMRPSDSVVLAGGRHLKTWNFSSEDWGQHFYVRIPADSATVDLEVENRAPMPDVSALRRILRDLTKSYRGKTPNLR